MKRSARLASAVALLMGLMSVQARAVDAVHTVKWVGGATGQWNDANVWKDQTSNVTSNAATLFGQRNGSDGTNSVSAASYRSRHIVIDGGSSVEFYSQTANGSGTGPNDWRALAGTTVTVKGGATWFQDAATYPENSWTQLDADLTLDNGTFRRVNESLGGDGGGLLLMGSYRDDANAARLAKVGDVSVNIKNGGKIENTGQLWFGADDEHSPNTRVRFNINNGSMDLTGGSIPAQNSTLVVSADLAFFYDYSETLAAPKNEQWEINFTGTGSIKVDSAGIWVYDQDSGSIWDDHGGAQSYQYLWDRGILKANGLSGKTGTVNGGGATPITLQPANFNDFFTVTGTPGSNDYTLTSVTPQVQTVEWVGGASGQWNDANVWKNTTTNVTNNAATLLGQRNGSDGMNTTSMATTRARNIVIGGGSTVEFYSQTANGSGTGPNDWRILAGTTMTVKDGATWFQDASTYPENSWTQLDGDLTLDNGTFRRSGESLGGDGGGLMLMGSYRDDGNAARLGKVGDVKVNIKNGGKLENTGQLWFGADDEHSPGTSVSVTINNGTMDLTGGTIPAQNSTLVVSADLAFFYDYSETLAAPKNENWEINFTGPGSITVDSAGIWVYDQDSGSIWDDHGGPQSYQYLWDRGILKANGLSGKTGTINGGGATPITLQPANFNDFFTVTGTPGSNNYILTSLITAPPTGVPGDYNGNGTVDAADYVLWRNGGPLLNEVDTPGTVNAADYTEWRARFGNTAGSGSGLGAGAVPEPASWALVLMGLAALGFRRRSA